MDAAVKAALEAAQARSLRAKSSQHPSKSKVALVPKPPAALLEGWVRSVNQCQEWLRNDLNTRVVWVYINRVKEKLKKCRVDYCLEGIMFDKHRAHTSNTLNLYFTHIHVNHNDNYSIHMLHRVCCVCMYSLDDILLPRTGLIY